MRNFILIGWLDHKEFPRNVKYRWQVPTACQRRWVLLLLVIRTNITSRLGNALLLQLFQYILRQNSMPPVLVCSPSRLPPIQTTIDKSESTGVDFRRLVDKVSLATSKLVTRAAPAFRFLGIAEIWGQERCWGRNLCNLNVKSLILVTTLYVLG